MAENQGTMDMFLTRALQRMHKDASRRPALREACTSTLELVKKIGINAADVYRPEMMNLIYKLVGTLKLACESRFPKVMSTALDCLQKLMAYGFIRGDMPDPDKSDSKLMDKVIDIISRCFDFPDNNVQLQMIKAFLTAVSTPTCDVHKHALLHAVRTCYNIYLMSKNQVNQVTAKATLTQMLDIVFRRLEATKPDGDAPRSPLKEVGRTRSAGDGEEPVSRTPGGEATGEEELEIVGDDEADETDRGGASAAESDRSVSGDNEAALPESGGEETPAVIAREIVLDIIAGVTGNSSSAVHDEPAADSSETGVGDGPEEEPVTPNGSAPDHGDTARGVEESPVADDEEREVELTSAMEGKMQSGRIDGPIAASALVDMNDAEIRPEIQSSELAYADCFLIFRALCKLSMKELPSASANNSPDRRNKVYSLELLHSIVNNAGPVLRSHEKFIKQAIKKYLCYSLLSNGVSPVNRVFHLSLEIFFALLTNFKDFLKKEMEVFFSKILLRILSSANSTVQQKLLVLQVMLKVCNDPQTVVDIFVNYDCDIKSTNLFEQTVNELAAIAKCPPQADSWTAQSIAEEENEIRLLSLECIVMILKSLVDWSAELREAGGTEARETDGEGGDDDVHDVVKKFEEQKQYKQQLEHGKEIFNIKPKKGIAFFVAVKHLEKTPKDVARFLLTEEGLHPKQIGEYLGDHHAFNKSVLYAYVDLFNFAGQEIDQALRNFLSNFRLPGEAEQIDRMMEKFAERYFNDNPGQLFENADAVYVFAFHMIMLATDLHAPAIKKKISKADWIKNNTGLNDGKDFSEKFLIQIYDRIQRQELRTRDMGEAPSMAYTNSELLNPKQRQILFHKEGRLMVKNAQDLLRAQLQDKSTFFKSTHIEHVRPMFELCSWPVLAAFSQLLETSEDNRAIELCLRGFIGAVRVSSIFFMETERDAFVSSLSKFTMLSNTREMKQKNIGCIKALIEIAHEDGNFLQDSWLQVLECISQLEKMHLIGTGTRPSDPLSPKNPRAPRTGELARSESLTSARSFEAVNATNVVGQINAEEIDKIFTDTIKLNSNAIVAFVRCLCSVSAQEVNGAEHRKFSLQKLVEIAAFNMDRIRFVWTRIWGMMAEHFRAVGVHRDLDVAMYAVDSLRQLAMKFLEKKELANYHFQKDFLKPFEHVIMHHKSLKIRELVVRCLQQMILKRAEHIKSGWKSIFVVFAFAAGDADGSIVSLAYFDVVEKIMEQYFHLIADSFFVECVNCLVAYASSNHIKEISISAIGALGSCAHQLVQGRVIPLERNEEGYLFVDDENHMRVWFPILTGLSRVVGHPHVDVRTEALNQLFRILTEYGNLFSDSLWDIVFRGVLTPIFHDVRYAGEVAQDQKEIEKDNEWLTTTCLPALTHLVTLFATFFDRISFLSNEFLVLLASCILQDNESLARIAATCLHKFVLDSAPRWSSDQWMTICVTFQFLVTNGTCSELLRIAKQQAKSKATPQRPIVLNRAIPPPSPTTPVKPPADDAVVPATPTSPVAVPPPSAATASRAVDVSDSPASEGEGEGDAASSASASEQSGDAADPADSPSTEDEAAASEEIASEVSADTERTVEETGSTEEGQSAPNPEDSAQSAPAAEHPKTPERTSVEAEHTTPEKGPAAAEEDDDSPPIPMPPLNPSTEAARIIFDKLVTCRPSNRRALERRVVHGRCKVQLMLIESIKAIVETSLEYLECEHVCIFLDALQCAMSFSSDANGTKEMWSRVTTETRLMQMLVDQERLSNEYSMKLLDQLYASDQADRVELAESRIVQRCYETLKAFLHLSRELPQTYKQAKVSMTLTALHSVEQYDEGQFRKHLPTYYRLFCDLALVPEVEIRAALAEIFRRVGRMYVGTT